MGDVRYGIVGTGMMGVEHIHNIRHLDGAVVTAIADTNDGSRTAGQKAAELDDRSVFSSHQELIAAKICDAVVVSTPNHTHATILEEVLVTDLHVLAEKPLCITVDECQRVVDLAERRTAISWMALEYRYKAPIARVLAEAHAGTVGEIHQVAIREHRFPFLPKVDNWNRFRRNTGGTLVEKCCHFFDLMNAIIAADPLRVMASGGQSVNHLDEMYDDGVPDILDNAYVIVDYANGARAMLDLCMFAEATQNEQEVVIVGDEGKLEAFVPESLVRIGLRKKGTVEEIATPVEAVYEGLHEGSSFIEHQHFFNAIRNDAEPTVGFVDGMRAVAIGVAAHRSINEGRIVDMAEVL